MTKANEEVLKTVQEAIEKAKKALSGLDRGADPAKYRQAHKRLKRAQRSLARWKKVSAKLDERMKAKLKKQEKAATAAAPAPEKPAKKEEATGEKPATESAPPS